SLDRFDDDTRALLATAAVAGSGTPLAVLALANACTTGTAAERLDPAVREDVLAEAAPSGVRFHHALLAEAATRLGDARDVHERLPHTRDTVGARCAKGPRPQGTPSARSTDGRPPPRTGSAPRRAMPQSARRSRPRARWP